ncbi:hypothetical protein PMAYCL1PPCAC_18365 [Pristionchus mayeri]|uniref:Uncharacterized protein n=1 Tax=Pristionchus mayeri TaxID=1317129 RepID=A0AAN5CPE5_9BILA|nr:hypothetical protein PMAYCL1PPCAC_18365 [Pristionchus mayeri]
MFLSDDNTGKKGAMTKPVEERKDYDDAVTEEQGETGATEDLTVVIDHTVVRIDDEQEHANEMEKRLGVYDKIDEEEEPENTTSQKKGTQSISVPLLAVSIRGDGMETDDDEWNPSDEPRELTPPRTLFTSQDPYLSQSQSLFGSLRSSPHASFSSQSSSSLLGPSINATFNLSSSLLPSQALATSTQIPMSQAVIKEEESEKQDKKPTASGPRVRPTFGKRK